MTPDIAPSLAIYIHWPFCVSKCPYCDFNSHLAQTIDSNEWTTAYLNELRFSKLQAPNHYVKTIFFGGGTPSLMPPKLMGTLIESIQTLWNCADDLEITFEANPTSVEAQKFNEFKLAGANRVSIGLQALNDQDLKFLGRPHSLKEGLDAIEVAKKSFDRLSFDLIYARPNQTLDNWEQELEKALNLKPTHISLYQLTIEPGTAFHTAYSRGEFHLPSDNLSTDLYQATESILKKHGLIAYEVSNYALPGEECRHNLMYWKYQDYIGIGPGAHGRITTKNGKVATRRHRSPDHWLNQCLKNGNGEYEINTLTRNDEIIELLLMGLRLRSGISLQQFLAMTNNVPPKDYFGPKWDHLLHHQLVTQENDHFKTTQQGGVKINSILNYLFT